MLHVWYLRNLLGMFIITLHTGLEMMHYSMIVLGYNDAYALKLH